MMARLPHVDSLIGMSVAHSEVFRQLVFRKMDGVHRQKSVIDGEDRIIAVTRAKHFPVSIQVTMLMDDVLAEWDRQVMVLIAVSLFGIVAILASLFVLAKHIEELTSTRADLVVAREHQRFEKRFRIALSNMSQGLAMFDRDNRLLICNDR